MPDPTRSTVSASQIPALFGRHRYITRWMLWQHLAHGVAIDDAEDARMSWGKRMQPLLLAEVGAMKKLEVRDHGDGPYIRRGFLGCTPDGLTNDPQRGPGYVETKCVFDYRTWMERWGGGEAPPPDVELQLQAQLAVGDGDKPFDWGIIAAWVGGDMHLFDRARDPEITAALEQDARVFLQTVRYGPEPDPLGEPREAPIYAKLWPQPKPDPQRIEDPVLGQTARDYEHATAQADFWKKSAEDLKAKLLAAGRDHAETFVPGAAIRIKRTPVAGRTTVTKPYVQTRLTVSTFGEVPPPSKPTPAAEIVP